MGKKYSPHYIGGYRGSGSRWNRETSNIYPPLADKDFQNSVPPYISELTGLSDRLVAMRKKQIALTTFMILYYDWQLIISHSEIGRILI